MAEQGRYTAAICAAPKVLASSGLLDGRTATSFPGILAEAGLTRTELSEQAVVRDGSIITSRGPGTAMDFALSLIEVLCGEDKRREVEQPLMRA